MIFLTKNMATSIGGLIISGVGGIIYIATGFIYLQQGTQQKEFEKQIAKISPVVAKQLPPAEKLKAEYEDVNILLAPITERRAIKGLVDIAEESGINIDSEGKFIISPTTVTVRTEKVGAGSYQVLSFKNISVHGDYDSVMAFISTLDSGEMLLDSGEMLKTMVLKRVRVDISQAEAETAATMDVDIYTKPGE